MNRIKINSHWQWVEAIKAMEALRQREVYGVKIAKTFIEFTDSGARAAFANQVEIELAALKGQHRYDRTNPLNSLRRHLGGALK